MGTLCFGSCGGSGYLSCGTPCPVCNANGQPRNCGDGIGGFSGPYIRGMFTGEVSPDVVFDEEEE
jgi:hypothetical protein